MNRLPLRVFNRVTLLHITYNIYAGEPHNQNETTKTTLLQQKDLSDT